MLLAMDTTLAACSVALADGDTLLGHQKQVMERGQAEALLPMVEDVVRAAGREMADITRIAVTSGP
ncbi:MAG: tRNA (adenosine(37)-N6)-threonylcarbamoyltransferase complex dimerization subunit type 1 TsaB, partial [Sphingomonadales bacterium]|nr:tRNA (adenosine(37)-N6)-threonylcarbamoyltransferase complex dimerization subunit type 1 TsaB [Sphingomonadales bacterium]